MTKDTFSRPSVGLEPSRFGFSVAFYPNISFTVQQATVPPVSFGTAVYETPLLDINLPGEKITYRPLTLRLMVDEDLVVYSELYGWMQRLAFPTADSDWSTKLQQRMQLPPGTDLDMPTCECFLQVLNSSNNPVATFTFRDAFPIYLGELAFDTTTDGNEYMYLDVEFGYTKFSVSKG